MLRLFSDPGGMAGVFRLEGAAVAGSLDHAKRGFAQPGDVALTLHTSGSTAQPRVVPLTHLNLCHSARSISASLDLAADDRCLNIVSLFHVHGLISALLASLTAGASVVCTPGFHAVNFLDWLGEFRATWYTAAPAMHQAILGRAATKSDVISRSRLRFIRSGSVPLRPKLMAELESVFHVPVVEAYGMTETASTITSTPLPPGKRKPGSVGTAVNCEIAVMDETGAFLPAEQMGEIVVRGSNVTPGYENDPHVNQSSFAAGRWLRTGDEGRIDCDGYLFLTGRIKEIINRGGEKISPGEVDEVLMDHPAVAQAMAFALPDERLGEDIGAAVVLRDSAAPGNVGLETELREFVATRLADIKVPRRVVFLDEIPKGRTGKPQRRGLAEALGLREPGPATNREEVRRGTNTEPRTNTETMLAVIWQRILRVDSVGIHDDFLQLGGDSILGAQVALCIQEEFGMEIPMFRLFDAPTVGQLADWIDSEPKGNRKNAEPIRVVPRDEVLPLSFAQQRKWFLTQIDGESGANSIPTVLRLQGHLNVEALRASLDCMVRRHEVLRTRFPVVEGVPIQAIAPPYRTPLPIQDCEAHAVSELDSCEAGSKIHELAQLEAHRPFDLANDFPFRATLLRLREDDHVLLLTLHHIATDGWSQSVLLHELSSGYEALAAGSEPAVPELSIQYADYACWERRRLDGANGQRLEAYWKERLAGAPPLLELPTDRPRPVRQTFQGSIERALIPKDLTDEIQALSRNESVTLFMTLLAGFQALLSRYSGQTDVCVGSPNAHRIRRDTEPVIGLFMNMLALRTDVSGDPSFRRLLGRVRETALGAYDHQDLPFERIVEVLNPERSLSHSPLFQVMFQLRNFPEEATRLAGLTVTRVRFDPGTAQFDLTLEVTETGQGLTCALNYNTDLFNAPTVRRMLGHYRTLLEGAVRSPELQASLLPLLTDAEREQLLDWNRTAADYPQACAHELFEERAASMPQAVAAVFEGRQWTYRELNERADGIAGRLKDLGAGTGSSVAICMERSLEMLAGRLGIWKAGGAYVPLDPSYPKERIAFILQDAQALVLLTQRALSRALPESQAKVLFAEDCASAPETAGAGRKSARPDDRAYVMYTSGSTGRPKGVAIRHRSLVNLLSSMSRLLEVTASDAFIALTTISFDIAGLELFLPLITGARVAILDRETAADGAKLAKAIDKLGITIAQATPAAWQMLLETRWTGKEGLKILCGGEAMPSVLARQLTELGRVWNVYGPTETTIWSTAAELSRRILGSVIPIGRPLANTQTWVLDGNRQPVPVGIPGELHIGGDGLAEGYWSRPELTAEKFVISPEHDSRLYRTGDLVKYLPDGNLVFLRRIDDQVKIRGFRIELGEIERVLAEHPSVRASAAKVLDSGAGDKRLVAYIVATGGRQPDEAELRDHLKRKLPHYMLPSAIVTLTDLSLTVNGKIDRNALVAPAAGNSAPRNPSTADGAVETVLTQIWEDILDRRPIGADENFFDLGGHSLLCTRLLARVERVFGEKLPLTSFFEAPTIARMASLLEPGPHSIAPSQVIPIRSSGSRPPLFILGPLPLFRALMLRLPEDQPVFVVSVPDNSTLPVPYRLEDLAAHYLEVIGKVHPAGPYAFFGWCKDGVLAYEMAQQVFAKGESVPLVVMIETFVPVSMRSEGRWAARKERLKYHFASISTMDALQRVEYIRQRGETIASDIRACTWRVLYKSHLRAGRRVNQVLRSAEQVVRLMVREYRPRRFEGSVLLIRAQKRPSGDGAALGWRGLVSDLEVVDVPGGHTDLFVEPNVEVMANAIGGRLLAFHRASISRGISRAGRKRT